MLEATLLTEKVSKLADVRSHVIMAQEHFQGWIPIAPLLGNASVRPYPDQTFESPCQFTIAAGLSL